MDVDEGRTLRCCNLIILSVFDPVLLVLMLVTMLVLMLVLQVNIIPVIGKSDSCTKQEVSKFKAKVSVSVAFGPKKRFLP